MPKRSGFDRLLLAACATYGYCGSLQDEGFVHVTDFIPERGRVTAEQFIDWLYMADEEPCLGNTSAMMRREGLRSCFIAYMGSEIVDAHRLRYSRHRRQRR
ncbi:hypothetical protein [Ancylobacter terrae]|uniref:hypothetical protein n=1 Tax=Ancylobacter sp. sgz301288 TaxID=3342077 RepID=UPI00385DFC4B